VTLTRLVCYDSWFVAGYRDIGAVLT